MKKTSLMSISIVASALLAVAPVATTAVMSKSTTPVVKAAATDKTTAEQALDHIKESFKSNSEETQIDDPDLWDSYALYLSMIKPVTTPTDIFDKDTDGSFADKYGDNSAAINDIILQTMFQKEPELNEYDFSLTPEQQQALKDSKVKFTMQISVRNGVDGTITNLNDKNSSDFEKTAVNARKNGGSISITYAFTGNNDIKTGKTVDLTFKAPAETSKNATAKIDPKKTTAKVGDAIAQSLPADDFDDVKFLDENGKDITNQLKGYVQLSRDIKDSKGNVVTGDKFTQPGDYTRAVTIDFKSLMGVKLVDENGNPVKASDPVIYNYTQALKDGKVKVILNGKEITLQDGVANFDAANGKYTYNRTISVTGTAISDKDKDKDKDIKVKDDPVTGVVTIKDNLNTSMAQLYDPKGRVIIDRALPMRSSWRTDYKRTINGIDYYRVSTEEYVRADQVNFKDNAAAGIHVGNINGAVEKSSIDNIFKVTGVGLTALWRISDDGQNMIVKPDRWLPQDSIWYTDQEAVIDGVTFYRLSTNEWVKADNGHLEK